MSEFYGYKEYPYTDKLKDIKNKVPELYGKAKKTIAEHSDDVEVIIKIIIIVVGVGIAIKEAITDAKISKSKNETGHGHVRAYCFLLDILNIIKRII